MAFQWRTVSILQKFKFLPFFSSNQGSDPSTYEMIQKIHTLQKRLISKTEEVVEKELLIQEKEKLYLELKHILARQPGPEVAEQLSIYQQTLKEKTKQMKVLKSFDDFYNKIFLLCKITHLERYMSL